MTNATPVALLPGRALTPMQRGLWMSQRRDPRAPMQNMALLTHIDGVVDAERLAAAFATVVDASDVLRSRFHEEGGTPVVRLAASAPATEFLRLPRTGTVAWATERARQPIDLSERVYDSVVIEHDDGTTSWYLNLHHTVTDATSSALVFDYTAKAYHGELVEIPSYYRWAEATANDRNRDRATRHWADRPAAEGISGLYRPHDGSTTAAVRQSIELDEDTRAAIDVVLADRFRMVNDELAWTTLMTTALSVYLHRLSGATRFAVGLPIHNRRTADTQRLLGPLMEVYPVDIEIGDAETFATLHKRIARSIMNTLRNAVPGTAPTPDYQAVVNVIPRASVGQFGPNPTSTQWVHSGAIEASHLVRFQRTGYDDELVLDLNTGAAEENHQVRAPAHLARTIRSAVQDPDQPIDRESLCTPDELVVLDRWEQGSPTTGDPVDITTQIRRGLATEAVVLQDGDRSWTGTDLLAWIDALTVRFQQQGVGPGTRVGLQLERSAEVVAAIAAVLAAGGSYVPLDPSHPPERRTRLARRAGCALIVDSIPSRADLDESGMGPAPDQRRAPAGDTEAYLLFTSGSTGEPKGVPITRRGLSRYLEFAAANYVPPDTPLVVPLFGSLTYDLTVTSLFLPLVCGGRSIVIGEDGPAGLASLARQTDVTWCKATPSHLEILDRLLPLDHRIRTFVVGGEAFRTELADRLLTGDPSRVIFNEYGPTEAVVGCMIHRYAPADGGTDVPIGTAAPGVTLRIVDRALCRVPIGAPGELCVASDGLTNGYLDPTVADPFVDFDGRRFYRTGDLVRLVDEHTAVYLGRIDEQVKVGGIRLEPTEVEAALAEHPAVAAAAVRLWAPSHRPPREHCVRCGLPDNVPDVEFDDDGVCATCRTFDLVAPVAESWFGTADDLVAIRDRSRSRRRGGYDCLHLLSGGKDSTYALYRLVELGFEPYVLTLDNGFISEQAKANIQRTIADLGLDHELATTPAMNAIFRDSLDRHANVCHGCYKTIYTLATNRAAELGIPTIVTGLSRGQLFETRLIPQQFSLDRFDPDAIDRAVLEARKAYHRIDDGPRRLLDTSIFETDDIFDEIDYVDIYRYLDVPLEELLGYLDREAPWVRPSDTGRSTNCRVNDVGIHTHLIEQGYHNYAIPYAWDVRLGHKTRDEAMEELDDRLDQGDVDAMLAAIDYRPTVRRVLTAWYVPDSNAHREPSPAELRSHLGALLPAHAIPAAFVAVDSLPLTESGKLDQNALPPPRVVNRRGPAVHVEPRTALESTIIEVWEKVLRIEPIGIDDDFFSLGGDSLGALEMIIAVSGSLDTPLGEDLAFINTTPRTLAAAIEAAGSVVHHREPPDPPPPGDTATDPTFSEAELAMLFEARRVSATARFNVGHLHRVAADIDLERFREAVVDVAARHQPLSWTFGTPRRHLAPESAVSFDLSQDIVDEVELERLVARSHRSPFDLDGGPLLRVLLRRCSDSTTAVLLVVHHVSADAEGLLALWRQIDTVYSGGDLPSLETDYSGFTAWQSANVDGRSSGFWLEQPTPDASLVIAPSPEEPDGFVRRPARFGPDALRAVPGISGSALVLSALATALGRRAVGTRIGVGLIASTRTHPAARPLVGYFLNTLPIVVDLPAGNDDQTFGDWCTATTQLLAPALAHREYPLARIVADRREAGRQPETPDVLLAYDELPAGRLGGAPSEHEVLFNGVAVAPLTVFVEVRDDRVDLAAEYGGASFCSGDIESLLDDLEHIIVAGSADPSAPLAAIQPPASALADLSGEPLDLDTDPLGSIEQHLRAATTRPAVTCGDQTLTWGELAERSSRIGRALQEGGVSPGDRVIISLPRSADLVTAIVAVLRIGASYVPLDPTYPTERRALITERSAATAAVVPPGTDAPLTPFDLVTTSLPTADGDAHRLDGADSHLSSSSELEAYAIFTSGSTGEPRGVPVSRRNLAASTAARLQSYAVHPGRFLVISSLSFDSSVAGLFWALATGGTVVLPTDDESRDVDQLLDLFERAEITHTLMVPTLYRGLLDRAPSTSAWPDLVVVAGESCPASLVARHHEQRPDSALYNEYGPTEATVWSSVHRCEPGDHPVPIGRPIPGVRARVVDPHGRLRPTGVIGELLISGPGVVDGYLNNEPASRAKFGVDDDGHPYFRTGDNVAAREGSLIFLGRVDDQLNIGGVRLEPEEVERALAGLPGVGAVVLVGADLRTLDELLSAASPTALQRAFMRAAGTENPAEALRPALLAAVEPELELVAHVEPDGTSTPDPAELRRQAADLLPATQRPRVVTVQKQLPRTANGKLDREAASLLPVIGPVAVPTEDLPANRTSPEDERAVAAVQAIFATVLRTEPPEPDDSFFELGGHSILALRLLQQLDARLGITLSVGDLYRHPTAASIVSFAAVSNGPTRTAAHDVLEIQTAGSLPPLFGVHVLGRNGVFYHPLSRHLGPNQPVYGLGLAGAAPDESTPHHLYDISARYADEVERIAPTGPVALAAVSIGAIPAVELAHRLEERGREVALLALFDAAGPDAGATALSKKARLQLHAQEIRKHPTNYVRERLQNQWEIATRNAQRVEIAARNVARRPLPDRLRVRAFVEQNVENAIQHRPQPIDAPILVFKAGDDVFTQNLVANGMGWNAISRSGVEVITVPGGHLSMLAEPHVGTLAAEFSAALERASSAGNALDVSSLETDVRRALNEHTLPSVIARWRSREAQIDPGALDLLNRVERCTSELSHQTQLEATRIRVSFEASDATASIAPIPSHLAFSFITIVTDSTTDEAQNLLADLGYQPLGRNTASYVDSSGRHRVQLIAADEATSKPADNGRLGSGEDVADLGLFISTPPGLIVQILDLAGPRPEDLIVDLGCGDGRVLIEAVRRYGCRARGIEIDPALARAARTNVAEAGLGDRVEIVEGDANDRSLLADATIVFAFLPPAVVRSLVPDIVPRLGAGKRFLTHEQLATRWPIEPTESALVVADGITVAFRWDGAEDDPS